MADETTDDESMILFPAGTRFRHDPRVDTRVVRIQFPDEDSAIVFLEWCRQKVIEAEDE